MRARYIYRGGEKIYAEEDGVVLFDHRDRPQGQGPMVIGDIKPYQSMIDGREITSRSRHREHLKANNCIEVGNERLPPRRVESPPGLKQDLIDAFHKARK